MLGCGWQVTARHAVVQSQRLANSPWLPGTGSALLTPRRHRPDVMSESVGIMRAGPTHRAWSRRERLSCIKGGAPCGGSRLV